MMQCGYTLGKPKEKKDYLHPFTFLQHPAAGGTEQLNSHWSETGHLKNRPNSFRSKSRGLEILPHNPYQGKLSFKEKNGIAAK